MTVKEILLTIPGAILGCIIGFLTGNFIFKTFSDPWIALGLLGVIIVILLVALIALTRSMVNVTTEQETGDKP